MSKNFYKILVIMLISGTAAAVLAGLIISVIVTRADTDQIKKIKAQQQHQERALFVLNRVLQDELTSTHMHTIRAKITVYHKPRGSITASGVPLEPGFHCAISPSLEQEGVGFGDMILIPNIRSKNPTGLWLVVDRTDQTAVEGKVLDLSMGSNEKLLMRKDQILNIIR